MQILLTQEEYDILTKADSEAKKRLKEIPDIKKLQEFCTKVADTMVVEEGWAKGRIWGCIRTVKHEHYCDECPAEEVCPYEFKEWSK